MSLIQRFFCAVFPARWAAAMEASSRQWILRCLICGREKSVWDTGGIRWKAASTGKRQLVWCPQCQKYRCASLEHRASPASGAAQ